MKLLIGIAARVLGQGLITLTNFIVSFAAAHSLPAAPLAIFFIAWTLETMWIAAIRGIAVPAVITAQKVPSIWMLLGLHSVAVIPIAGAIYGVSFIGGLEQWLCLLITFTPFALGSYELVRTYLSLEDRSTLSVSDSVMLGLTFGLFLICLVFLDATRLFCALVALIAATVAISLACATRIHFLRKGESKSSVMPWFRGQFPLLRVGFLEWLVFFAISMAGVGILGLIGGPEVLSGVRLAETLLAPLSIASSAIPLILAPFLTSIGEVKSQFGRMARIVAFSFSGLAVIWVGLLALVPIQWLEVIVGEHALLAKYGVLGLGLGVCVSYSSVTIALVLKLKGAFKQISTVRWMQLGLSIPLMAVAALSGNVLIAALGMSAGQVFACYMLAINYKKLSRNATLCKPMVPSN